MNINEEELNSEKEYLVKVKEIIQKIIDESKKSIDHSKSDLTSIKRFMWDNLSSYTDAERAIALNDMDVRVSFTNDQIHDLYKYEKARNNPYFGKIKFKYKDKDITKSLYIGMKNIADSNNTIYVHDWRAPISSLFYNYEIGPASFDAPVGTIDGELLSKMQFKIENGELVRCFNCDLNIDDDYLQEILSNTSSSKMKNIVNTIQREQNKIIRNDNDKYLIVQGVAGSGKTSVALHRIAYLLYKNKNLGSNNVLIFSPNDVFSDYISNVLPELGEENVLTTTLYDFAKAFLKTGKTIESYSEFLDRMYSNNSVKEATNNIRYKLSSECKRDIDEFFNNYESSISFKPGLKINGKYFPYFYLNKLFAVKYNKLPIQERITQMAEYICLTSNIPVKKNLPSVRKKLNELSNIEYNYTKLYQAFLDSKGLDEMNSKKINYEDIVALIYTYFKVYGVPAYGHIKHAIIDEAQDYSEFQFDVLKSLFKNASFTILGDVYQTINPYYKYNSLSELNDIFDGANYIELNKTYRSSEEIIDYSNKILGLSNVRAIRNSINIPVDIKKVPSNNIPNTLLTDINSMRDNGMEKIAIITKTSSDAQELYKQLSINHQLDLQLVLSSTESMVSPIVIIPSYLSKGLEFDGVIVCNPDSAKYVDGEQNLYYVVCTRAQHELNIYNEPIKILKK